jgi:hypothetical protein
MRPVVSANAEKLWQSLGPWRDADGEATGWALLHFCEAHAGGNQIVDDLARDTDAGPGWSGIVDLARVPDDFVVWLAQFVGISARVGDTTASIREEITNRPRTKRGTPATVISAAQSVLSGSARVMLTERDTSAYHFLLQTYVVQTPDAQAVVDAVNRVKPGGVMWVHELLTGPSYAQVETATPPASTYADRKAMFPTYADVMDYVP